MMVVDTSVWLEIFLNQSLKKKCLHLIKRESCLVPSLCFFEVLKKVRFKISDLEAMEVISALKRFPVLDLTPEVALYAADLSHQHNLAMADSIVLSHALTIKEELLTLDNDFESIPHVKIIR